MAKNTLFTGSVVAGKYCNKLSLPDQVSDKENSPISRNVGLDKFEACTETWKPHCPLQCNLTFLQQRLSNTTLYPLQMLASNYLQCKIFHLENLHQQCNHVSKRLSSPKKLKKISSTTTPGSWAPLQMHSTAFCHWALHKDPNYNSWDCLLTCIFFQHEGCSCSLSVILSQRRLSRVSEWNCCLMMMIF